MSSPDRSTLTQNDVTVGNTTDDRSKVRTDSGVDKEKSEWSFTDRYYTWTPNHSYSHGHYWTYEIFDYTAKHLQSSTRVHIVNVALHAFTATVLW